MPHQSSTDPIVHARNLTRTFRRGRITAVRGLNLEVRPGEIFGLVGPDGTGKTTTLRLLAGLLDISAGELHVLGYDMRIQAEAAKPHLGYMAQQFSLYGDLSVEENLRFFGALYGVPEDEFEARMARLLHFARLEEFRHRRARYLSGGMQKKLALACTLIHQPQLLILDEPTTGVDPVSRREFWDLLTELHTQGTTIIVSTPYMDEAERCHRVGLLYQGQMVMCAPPDEIRRQVPGELVVLQVEDAFRARQVLQRGPGVVEVQTYGESLHLFLDDRDARLPALKDFLAQEGIRYTDLRFAEPRVEEAFVSLIRRLRAQSAPGEEAS